MTKIQQEGDQNTDDSSNTEDSTEEVNGHERFHETNLTSTSELHHSVKKTSRTPSAESRKSSTDSSPSSSSSIVPNVTRRRKISVSQANSTSQQMEPVLRISNHKTVYTKGRPPWYDCQGQLVEPFVIGISGGSASGKTTVAKKIIKELGVPWVTLLSMDSFYKVLTPTQHVLATQNEHNFDHPDAFDFSLLLHTLRRLRDGKKVEVPIYNFVTHTRDPDKSVSMYGASVLIFEGILAFHSKEVLDLLNMKIFVDTDSDVRLSRRLHRDISQRGRDLKSVLQQYDRHVKPSFDYYIAPSMLHADIIVPRGGENEVAIDLIVRHVQTQLELRSTMRVRRDLVRKNSKFQTNSCDGIPTMDNSINDHSSFLNSDICATTSTADLRSDMMCSINDHHTQRGRPSTLKILPKTRQTVGLHTIIRNRNTSRDEFIFYAKRLIRLVIEYALSFLPYEDTVIQTPQNISYDGVRSKASKICGVSILRAGETMEAALTQVCQDIRVGKILIQTSGETGEPELYYLRLPKDIKDYTVLVMDATVATGAASMMAIRVLLDHEVPESNIYLVSLLMAESGVNAIAYAFPQVHIVTSAVDAQISEQFYVLPGIGNFGDRYFGTEPRVVKSV